MDQSNEPGHGESSSPLKEMKSDRGFIGAGEIRAVDANVDLDPVDVDKLREISEL